MDHIRAEAERWMSTNYGRHSCQWWYQFIKRQVFLEEDLNEGISDAPLTDFRFHVINGKVALLQMDVGLDTEERHNPIYDGNLTYLPYSFLRRNLREEPLPPNADKARDIAQEMGKDHQYCRVDLYLKEDNIFLGELTFLPNAGRRKVISPELDEMLMSYWDPMPRFVRVT
jgi:hypothetical protein